MPQTPSKLDALAADNQRQLTTIEISKEYLHFSAAHFTLFSPTERENLHGHNFYVEASLEGEVGADGLCFDYNVIKSVLKTLCDSLDELVLLPSRSPYLIVRDRGDQIVAQFGSEQIPFLPRDVKLLPVRNITVEELSQWFLDTLACDDEVVALPIESLTLRVSSGPGQWASTTWRRP